MAGSVKLVVIAAMSRNHVLSAGGKIPWHLPRDTAHFRARSAGHWLLLGRRTFGQMSGWFQPGQVPVVLSRQEDLTVPGGYAVTAVGAAVKLAAAMNISELLVCGGGQVYATALPLADEVILTTVQTELEGDVFFPELPSDDWRETAMEWFPADEENEFGIRISRFLRIRSR